MFTNYYLGFFLLNIISCLCFVNYEMFEGFDIDMGTSGTPIATSLPDLTNQTILVNFTTTIQPNVTQVMNLNNTGTTHPPKSNQTLKSNSRNKTKTPKKIKLKTLKQLCPETEKPVSLGSYLIPTQRDLVLFTKRYLLKMFNSYHKKTLYLLKDIEEATIKTQELEKLCIPNKVQEFRHCVKLISKICEKITKDLVASMERKKDKVAELIEEKTCNMTAMKTDPIELIKMLAMNEASLEFALPAFLRLIGGCSTHCSRRRAAKTNRRPSRYMTDQNLVVRHFLTKKYLTQLIKDSGTHV